MFQDYQICPYTGLRSFTEEESLYFKGREEHIDQATTQLQRNKFLMLTGASGDGKSSLVYAGIIPNARAGFLKSKYTQWCLADFRPERSPFQNLCRSVGKQLGIPNPSTVGSELQHGFSALVDLYKNSNRFVDTGTAEWKNTDEKKRSLLKRDSANLIILVDQFEEFFTNPENYSHGVPSGDSNLVLNLLLETARIALEEDLPIYIVFTMRSDFIGQCAAFRGLPEYIGFSQFFVPRLNRSQLQLVIEEPAVLSGNRITRRLTERLIHDVTDGVDQLPILQHALSQIWLAANNGIDEMDLLHYAMVGGMPAADLPEDQVQLFNRWFAEQPTTIKAFYREPDLQNVLDTHTNKLYEQAAAHYTLKTGIPLSDADAKAVIKNAFTCLTKIDQSRAVRNRMTLVEITEILGHPGFDEVVVGNILNIFREAGNTFIRPFITDDPGSQALSGNQVLDITHESLIRNWTYLEQWAKEEFDSYSVSLDFGKQVSRWVKSGKTDAYLLSIGPLTYFEAWFTKVKPNASWIARYLPREIGHEKKLNSANRILANTREFLRRSAKKHSVTRLIMRYGAARIAAGVGILAILTLSSFAVNNYYHRQNEVVYRSIDQQAAKLFNEPKVVMGDKITLAVQELKSGRKTVSELIAQVGDPVQKINVSTGIASLLALQAGVEPKSIIRQSLSISDSLLSLYKPEAIDLKLLSALLKEMNDLRVALEFAYYYNPDVFIGNLRKKNANRSAHWAEFIALEQPKGFDDITEFELALENGINYRSYSPAALAQITNALSPIDKNPSAWVVGNFAKDKLLIRGHANYGYYFNGHYQLMAYLYAAMGDVAKVVQCTDSLLRYSQANFLSDYGSGVDNAANVAAVFYLYNEADELNGFVKAYCSKKGISEEEFYARLLGRMLHSTNTAGNLDLLWWMGTKQDLNLQFSGRDQLSFFYSKHRNAIRNISHNEDEKNLLLAISFKNQGIAVALDRMSYKDSLTASMYFDKAVELYRKVSKLYLNQPQTQVLIGAVDEEPALHKYFFLYPDIKTPFQPLEPRSYFYFYSTDAFVQYIMAKGLVGELYPTGAEASYFIDWLLEYNSTMFAFRAFLVETVRYKTLQALDSVFASRNNEKTDLSVLYLYLGKTAQQLNKEKDMLYYYRHVDPKNIFNLLHATGFSGNVAGQSFRLIGYGIAGFAQTGHLDEAWSLVKPFKKPTNRATLFAFAASELQRDRKGTAFVQQLLDSATAEMRLVNNIVPDEPDRQQLAYALALQDPQRNSAICFGLIKNIETKFAAIGQISSAYAFNGKLYGAMNTIPQNISDTDQAIFLSSILSGASESTRIDPIWVDFQSNYPPFQHHPIVYTNEGI